jgi:hypothetical protein
MSRVFDQNTSNVLTAAVSISSDRAEYTMGCWVKPNSAFNNETHQVHVLNSAFNQPRLTIAAGNDPYFTRFYPPATGNLAQSINLEAKNQWILLIGRQSATTIDIRFNGVQTGDTDTYTAMLAANVTTLRIGSGEFVDAYGGKIAHVFAFTRRLSDSECQALEVGGNPNDLSATARWYYYPLTDDSLTNVWTPDGSDTAGTLTVNGTVPSDTGDNPNVSGSGGPPIQSLFATITRNIPG